MTAPSRPVAIIGLAVFLGLAAALAVSATPLELAVTPAGPVRSTAAGPFIANVTPWDGDIVNTTTPLIVVVYVPVSAAIANVSFHLDGMNLSSAGEFNNTMFLLPLALELRNGPHLAEVTVYDDLGGVGSMEWNFTVDTTPPVLIVTAPAYPIVPSSTVLVEGTAVLASSYFALAAPITVTTTVLPRGLRGSTVAAANGLFSLPVPLSEGANTIFVNATDRLGNRAVEIVGVLSDTVKPPLVVLTPANRSVSPTDLVRVSGLSEFGAFVTVNGFSVIVAPNGTWSVVLALPEGLNILQIAAADQVGNINYTGLAVFVDSDAPQVVLTSPTETLTNQDRVVVSGTVTDTKVVVLLVNGNPVTFHADGTFSTTLSLPEGLDPIIVVAVDAAQHVTTVTTSVRVDTTAPVVTVSTPPDGLETKACAVVIRGTVDDVNATVLVDDQTIRPDASGHWQASVALLPGGNAVSVSAVDAAGNRAATILIHIAVFSPIPDLQNGTSANARSLDEQEAVLRFSLVGIVLLFVGITFVLYSRTSRRLREDRRVLAALVRRLPPKR